MRMPFNSNDTVIHDYSGLPLVFQYPYFDPIGIDTWKRHRLLETPLRGEYLLSATVITTASLFGVPMPTQPLIQDSAISSLTPYWKAWPTFCIDPQVLRLMTDWHQDITSMFALFDTKTGRWSLITLEYFSTAPNCMRLQWFHIHLPSLMLANCFDQHPQIDLANDQLLWILINLEPIAFTKLPTDLPVCCWLTQLFEWPTRYLLAMLLQCIHD